MKNSASVDLSSPSYYHSPKSGSLKDRLSLLYRRYAYNIYRKQILQHKKSLNLASDFSILEIGCGPGYLSSFLEKWFPEANITAFEYDQRLINEAKERCRKVDFINGNAEELGFDEEQFDVVISLHLIEHLYTPSRMLDGVYKALKRRGLFILATPNPAGIGANIMGAKWRGYRDDHVSLKSPQGWSTLLQEANLTPLKESTTLLSGIPWITKTPLIFINALLLVLFGAFPWKQGEAYIATCTKT